MASRFSFRSSYNLDSARSEDTTSSRLPNFAKFSKNQQLKRSSLKNNPLRACVSSSRNISLSRSSSKSLSSIPSSGIDNFILEDEPSLGITTHTNEFEFNHLNCLIWVLHHSARSFSLAIQSLDFAKTGPELSNAWNGIDVNAWHKHTAYQVAVYALLKAAIEVGFSLSQKRSNSQVYEILSSKTSFLGEFIETQLNSKHPKLIQWFRTVELPRITGLFLPLFKKWSAEYSGSGVAGVILAVTCCTSITKLGSHRVSCPQFTASIDDSLAEFRDLSCDLVSVDKLHNLSIKAGFEEDFLLHCGKKVLPSKNIEDVEFWIGLVKKKLSLAFHRESVIIPQENFIEKVEETTLATLGIFAYLGRETRLYLSDMNIKEMDDQIKDFLSYLECGSLYIYPEFNSLAKYQLFIEVVIDEISWLDFYAPLKCKFQYDGRRFRKHQTEKEIILYTVLTVCYDVFSGFVHYTTSSQKPLNSDVLSFLSQSQALLSNCLEEYWATYDKSGEVMKFGERVVHESFMLLEAHSKPIELMKRGNHEEMSREIKGISLLAGINHLKVARKRKRLYERLLRKSTEKVIYASNIVCMGTQLLFIDVGDVIGLLVKQLHGKKITNREKRKIKRTLNDMVTLVPVTILMLIPVSAVGHAAILAAINKYVPSLIPSPYSSERLNLVRQLKRTKKMEVGSWVIREANEESEGGKSFTVVVP
ncbi:uncharacterized protein LOC111900819 [Lactuca sativa]|uniref:uncharacterized protein LOC111900819 n=1 Tax=Lactuca sativa TaxID=4236 RepID=UPI000CC7D146|nr:uncharacterized protein LOC111900819 [Lactuca sativa]